MIIEEKKEKKTKVLFFVFNLNFDKIRNFLSALIFII